MGGMIRPFDRSGGSDRPNSLFILMLFFIILLTISMFQVSKLALNDHEMVNELETVRLTELASVEPLKTYEPDFWAKDYLLKELETEQEKVDALLDEKTKTELYNLCGRTIYHTLTRGYAKSRAAGGWTFVATGDIPDMWIRDSSVQLGIYIPKVKKHPFLRGVIEGLLKTQAFFIVQDPYANAFSSSWRDPESLNKFERLLGRGGWVGTRNYELDSSTYFLQFLWNYITSKDIHAGEHILNDPLVFDAVQVIVDVWITEQNHETKSPYRYSELEREGLGPKTGYTGMTWSGFRPSDDANKYGYSIPSNVYAASALYKVIEMNRVVWKHAGLHEKASKLLNEIETGIETHGIIEVSPGVKVYAYEVDGLDGVLADFDDANLPSLLSLPLLGWPKLDMEVYKTTRERLLSSKYNEQFFEGSELRGIGSEHTMSGFVWPLALVTEALTDSPEKKAEILKMLLKTQCRNGLMHESINSNNVHDCTRPEFEWANAMLVVLVENSLGYDCDESAQHMLEQLVSDTEAKDHSKVARNGGKEIPAYFSSSLLETFVQPYE
jgi:meiotically up-regulated gene 157 (Mug157) protein